MDIWKFGASKGPKTNAYWHEKTTTIFFLLIEVCFPCEYSIPVYMYESSPGVCISLKHDNFVTVDLFFDIGHSKNVIKFLG